MNTNKSPSQGLLVSSDLFFSSKVTGTAGGLGLRVDVVGDVKQAAELVSNGGYGCLILDLAMPDLVVADLLESLPDEGRPTVIAFGSHVNTVRLAEAREAGCDEVMPRSRFSAELPQILRRYLGEPSG